MRRFIFLTAVLFVAFVMINFVSLAEAVETTVLNTIPGRYALVQITGVAPGEMLNKEAVTEIIKPAAEEHNLKTVQIIVYGEGQTPGGGSFRAFGEICDEGRECVDYEEVPILPADAAAEEKQKQDEYMKKMERLLGYEITPKELHDIYMDNEVVADEDFKGKILILKVTVPKVSKNAFNKPYISVPTDKHGFQGLALNLDMSDPLLRSVKSGDTIAVRAVPTGMMMNDVQLNAEIVHIYPSEKKK
jgi:hypothetical protein